MRWATPAAAESEQGAEIDEPMTVSPGLVPSIKGPFVTPSALATDVTIIQPAKGWQAVDFRELWRHRELLYFLVWRDVKVRYKQTVMGAAWAVLQPVATMVVFTIVFGWLAKVSFEGPPYPIAVYAGLLPWTFFANAVTQAGVSLVNQAHLLTKIYFPRLFMPAACIGAGLVDWTLSFVVYFVLMVWYGQAPAWTVLLLPVLIALTLAAACGVGCLLASLTVVYRDFRFVVPFMVQIWMFLSAAPFPASLWSREHHWLLAFNPMFGIIKAFRSALLGLDMDWIGLAISGLMASGLLVFGLYNFRRMERRFADVA